MNDVRIKGIDISSYQNGIPFSEIKAAGVKFALIRAGSAKRKDPLVDKFVSECKKHGIKFGFYWYSYALTVDRAKEEAEYCLSVIDAYKPDYPVYYDIEDASQITELNTRTRTDMCHAFCDVMRKGGYTAGVYANPSWFNLYLYKSELVNDYEIWLAHWTENPNVPSRYNFNQRVWQWGLDCIAGYNTDGDISFCDYSLSGEKSASETPAAAIPSVIEQGSTVYFKGGYHYASSCSTVPSGGKRAEGLAKVQNIAPNAPHKYALIGTEGGSNVYGWVDESLVATVPDNLNKFAFGDKVRVKPGAKNYKGKSLASFVYKNVYSVMQIGSGVSPDYIVIGVSGVGIMDALHADDLIKV